MSIRIQLEIGHEASIRTKRTPEGFTHDWEVFVKGSDGADIHYFVEKVVFYLHETFPKPKRVIKEPPYSVKESGYAGFNLPIEIYLRNKDEPKKIRFNYDLNLQPSGPAISNLQKEKYVFNSPSEEFRQKLLKGGGALSLNSQDLSREIRPMSDDKTQLISKPKLGGIDVNKKHKIKMEEPRISNSFQELFGPPITKTTKVSPDPKNVSKDMNKNSSLKSEKGLEKDKSKNKHSPYKDKDRERDKLKSDIEKRNKEEKRSKERSKERDHIKDKGFKREKSPRPRSSTPKSSPKRSASPKRLPSPPIKHKDDKRFDLNKDKKIMDEKGDKKSKKEKRDKDRKDIKHKEIQKINEQKENKTCIKDMKTIPKEPTKDKEHSPTSLKGEKKDKKEIKDLTKLPKEPDSISEKSDKRNDKSEEKQKHRHKKKDKEKKDKKEDKDKMYKIEKKIEKPIKYGEKDTQRENDKSSLFGSPKHDSPPLSLAPAVETRPKDKPSKPLNIIMVDCYEDSSGSSLTSPDDMMQESGDKLEGRKESLFEPKKPKLLKLDSEKVKLKREKTKKNKDKKSDKETEKRKKRKSDSKKDDEPMEKRSKDETNSALKEVELEQNSANKEIDKENQENPEEYMKILRDLQQKIMSIQDNAELQKVVQLIAETGRFEVSARTFDFDLCLLDRSTVRQLQAFFEHP